MIYKAPWDQTYNLLQMVWAVDISGKIRPGYYRHKGYNPGWFARIFGAKPIAARQWMVQDFMGDGTPVTQEEAHYPKYTVQVLFTHKDSREVWVLEDAETYGAFWKAFNEVSLLKCKFEGSK